jgi:hypothetical protein
MDTYWGNAEHGACQLDWTSSNPAVTFIKKVICQSIDILPHFESDNHVQQDLIDPDVRV